MEPQFEELSARITRDVTAAVTKEVTAVVTKEVTAAVNAHVTEVVTAAERRLADQAQVNVEAVKDQAKLAARWYAGTLQSIERRDRIESRLDTQSADYDAVLGNHNQRISALERKH